MSLTLNMVGGGGGELLPTDAILRVQAPANSTVTITKGTTTKTDLGHENADDHTVYDYYFIIHQSQFDPVNPWTVTATLGTDTASSTIVIDAADEYDVVLNYNLVLFDYGVTDYTFQAYRTASSYGSGGVQFANDYMQVWAKWAEAAASTATWAYCTTTVDASKYSTVEIEYTSSASSTLAVRATYNGANLASTTVATNATAAPITATLDISSITGQVYWVVGIGSSNSTQRNVYVRKITFKP